MSASRQRTPPRSGPTVHCTQASECAAELELLKNSLREERATRGQLQTEQRQFLQELHALAGAIESRLTHAETQAAHRCVELVGPAVQEGLGLSRAEVEAVAQRVARGEAQRVEEALRRLREDVDRWRQEHIVVMTEFITLQNKVATCGERAERACRVAAVWDSAVGSLRVLVNGLGPALDSASEQLSRVEELSAEVQAVQQAVAAAPSVRGLWEEVNAQRERQEQLSERSAQVESALDALSEWLAAAIACGPQSSSPPASPLRVGGSRYSAAQGPGRPALAARGGTRRPHSARLCRAEGSCVAANNGASGGAGAGCTWAQPAVATRGHPPVEATLRPGPVAAAASGGAGPRHAGVHVALDEFFPASTRCEN